MVRSATAIGEKTRLKTKLTGSVTIATLRLFRWRNGGMSVMPRQCIRRAADQQHGRDTNLASDAGKGELNWGHGPVACAWVMMIGCSMRECANSAKVSDGSQPPMTFDL